MTEYKITQQFYDCLIVNWRYANPHPDILPHFEKITGWKLVRVNNYNKFSLPSIEKIGELEKLQGWSFPNEYKLFLSTFGRSICKDGLRLFYKIHENKELKLSMFLGLLEMLPLEFSDYNWRNICSATQYPEGKSCMIVINPKGQVQMEWHGELTPLTNSFSEFLDKLEVREVPKVKDILGEL